MKLESCGGDVWRLDSPNGRAWVIARFGPLPKEQRYSAMRLSPTNTEGWEIEPGVAGDTPEEVAERIIAGGVE